LYRARKLIVEETKRISRRMKSGTVLKVVETCFGTFFLSRQRMKFNEVERFDDNWQQRTRVVNGWLGRPSLPIAEEILGRCCPFDLMKLYRVSFPKLFLTNPNRSRRRPPRVVPGSFEVYLEPDQESCDRRGDKKKGTRVSCRGEAGRFVPTTGSKGPFSPLFSFRDQTDCPLKISRRPHTNGSQRGESFY